MAVNVWTWLAVAVALFLGLWAGVWLAIRWLGSRPRR